MRRLILLTLAIAFVALVAVVGVGLVVGTQEKDIRAQQTEIKKQMQSIAQLSTDFSDLSQVTSLDIQAKCQKAAEKEFQAEGWLKYPMASYVDHYNSSLHRCFVFITNMSFKTNEKGKTTENMVEELVDAFELFTYANFNGDPTAPLPDPYNYCVMTESDGSQKDCQSEGELKSFVKTFMGPALN